MAVAGENISKQRREKLLGHIASIKASLERSKDKNATQLLLFAAELEKEVRGKKFGLVFEEHREGVDEVLERNLPVLKEDKKRFIGNMQEIEAPLNFLIEGDNLAALKLLEKTHRGKVDLIYIDPPYNTGNKDFVYNDAFVDKNDTFRHSKWLSFMQKRLEIARCLMSDKGVIFISIDDNEQAELKLLCDDVFGHDNFISSIPWHSRQSLQNDTDFSINHEYIVCYAKNRRKSNRRLKKANAAEWHNGSGFVFYPLKIDETKYDNPDNDSRGPWKADPMDAPHIRPNLTYPITNPETGEQHLPPRGRHWRISQEKFASALADNRIVFGKSGKGRPQMKVFLNEQRDFGSIANSWFEAEKYGTATHGSKELQALFGGEKMFDSPKPTALIVELMKLASVPDKSLTVLDFFAGSGTTGHAVMKLNAEDVGRRSFILVTNNENGICEKVTYERLKRVMAKENYKARLKYLKVDYIPITEEDYWAQANKLLKYVRELVELENGVDFTHDTTVEIVLTDAEVNKLVENKKKLLQCTTVYLGHDVMVGKKERSVFNQHGIELKIIPDYYYPELEK